MAHPWINRELYEAILHFEESDAAQEYYYRVMDTEIERQGTYDTVRNLLQNKSKAQHERRQDILLPDRGCMDELPRRSSLC